MAQKIKTFRDLQVWQKAMVLVKQVYRGTIGFPKEETYGLTSQMRRCAVSIPSNIAEGHGRHATGDYVRFLRMSIGSLYELQTQLEIAKDLGYLTINNFGPLNDQTFELERMLTALVRKLDSK